jgi:hypothetical protein
MAKLGVCLGAGYETRRNSPSEALILLEDEEQAKRAAGELKMRHIIV